MVWCCNIFIQFSDLVAKQIYEGYNGFIFLSIISLYSPHLHFSREKCFSPESYELFSDRGRWKPPFSIREELILTVEWGSSIAELVLGPISIAPGNVL